MKFTAVRTTGIYCRPGCGATPLPHNTVGYPSAAAAEAAEFRPCLRCRPYRSAPVDIDAVPRLVCRAVSLILDGCLDDGSEDELAARLGVSCRHLHRLFDQHLGVSPDGLARSARAHLARRLLDETDLAITDIAFAAGFGSIRQFNRELHRVFHRPPRELRQLRHRADRPVADGGLRLRLPHHSPLDWPGLLSSAHPLVPGVEAVQDGTYRRTLTVRGDPGVLELGVAGPTDLQLTVHLPHWEELVHLVARARAMALLDEPRPHVQPPRLPPWSWFERAVAAVLLGQAASSDTGAALQSVIRTLGKPVPGLADWNLTHTFPAAATLTRANLRDCGVSDSDAIAVSTFVAAVRTRTVQLAPHWSRHQIWTALTIDGLPSNARHLIADTLGADGVTE